MNHKQIKYLKDLKIQLQWLLKNFEVVYPNLAKETLIEIIEILDAPNWSDGVKHQVLLKYIYYWEWDDLTHFKAYMANTITQCLKNQMEAQND